MKSDPHPEAISLTLEQAALRLGIGYQAMRKLIVSGEIPARKVGTGWIVGIKSLERWVNDPTPSSIHFSTASKPKKVTSRKPRVTGLESSARA